MPPFRVRVPIRIVQDGFVDEAVTASCMESLVDLGQGQCSLACPKRSYSVEEIEGECVEF